MRALRLGFDMGCAARVFAKSCSLCVCVCACLSPVPKDVGFVSFCKISWTVSQAWLTVQREGSCL